MVIEGNYAGNCSNRPHLAVTRLHRVREALHTVNEPARLNRIVAFAPSWTVRKGTLAVRKGVLNAVCSAFAYCSAGFEGLCRNSVLELAA